MTTRRSKWKCIECGSDLPCFFKSDTPSGDMVIEPLTCPFDLPQVKWKRKQ